MDLRAPLQLQTMIKAMSDVVLPALDPNDQMAQEQAQLVLGMLHLMASRLPLQFHYDVDELQRYLDLARDVIETPAGGPQSEAERNALAESVATSRTILDGAKTSPNELESAALDMRAAISRFVDSLWQDGDPQARDSAAKIVLAASREQIVRERAWFAPQGWDADMSAYPSIESLIDYPDTDDSPA